MESGKQEEKIALDVPSLEPLSEKELVNSDKKETPVILKSGEKFSPEDLREFLEREKEKLKDAGKLQEMKERTEWIDSTLSTITPSASTTAPLAKTNEGPEQISVPLKKDSDLFSQLFQFVDFCHVLDSVERKKMWALFPSHLKQPLHDFSVYLVTNSAEILKKTEQERLSGELDGEKEEKQEAAAAASVPESNTGGTNAGEDSLKARSRSAARNYDINLDVNVPIGIYPYVLFSYTGPSSKATTRTSKWSIRCWGGFSSESDFDKLVEEIRKKNIYAINLDFFALTVGGGYGGALFPPVKETIANQKWANKEVESFMKTHSREVAKSQNYIEERKKDKIDVNPLVAERKKQKKTKREAMTKTQYVAVKQTDGSMKLEKREK